MPVNISAPVILRDVRSATTIPEKQSPYSSFKNFKMHSLTERVSLPNLLQ
jgi:hypothetical protein